MIMEFETILPAHPFEFEEVSNFVHGGADYEDLQNLCLTMSANMQQERKTLWVTGVCAVFVSSLATSLVSVLLHLYFN